MTILISTCRSLSGSEPWPGDEREEAMSIINTVLTALALGSLFLMMAGLIRPHLVLTLAKQKTRVRVLTVFGAPFLSLAIAAFATGPLAIKQPKEEGHPFVKGQVPAAFQKGDRQRPGGCN